LPSPAFDIDAYAERIGLPGLSKAEPSEDLLEQLHRAQAYSIPFENFDILLGRGISLQPDALFNKLVMSKRGGYCFELNALLQSALASLGFGVRPLLGRVHASGTPTGRIHQLGLVELRGRDWIVDVGFGRPGLVAPIPFELDQPRTQDGNQFRLIKTEPFGNMLQSFYEDQWHNLYSFDLDTVLPVDIEVGNHFTSTEPEFLFVINRVATLPNPNGRLSLLNLRLKISEGGKDRFIELEEGQPYLNAVQTYFGTLLSG